MRALIVNADDLGWSEDVNLGIAEAHRHGILTSASLLANGSAFSSGVALARNESRLGIGVHLNLSDGPPTLTRWEVPGLVNASGLLHNEPGSLPLKLVLGRISLHEVEREWDAQIRKIRDAGIAPTHLDGHKHVHMLPGLFAIALHLAERHAIRAIRLSLEAPSLRKTLSRGTGFFSATAAKQSLQACVLRLLAMDAPQLAHRGGLASADFFCGIAQTGLLTQAGLENLLRNLPEGTTELMTHPGYASDGTGERANRLQNSRERELAILTSPETHNLVASLGIRLVHYGFVTF